MVSFFFFFSSRRRHTRCSRDWSSDVCSSDLREADGDQGIDPPEEDRRDAELREDVYLRASQAPSGIHFARFVVRSEEHTSELQSRLHLVCRLLLEKKKKKAIIAQSYVSHISQ